MRIKCIVEYQGTNYYGWQKQVGQISIEEEIEKVLSQILNTTINIYASGRTDAGVHAKGQVFHFDIDKNVDLNRLKYSTNMMLPEDINILSMEEVENEFHARYAAKNKTYEYKILLKGKDPFNYKNAYLCPQELDIDLFENALKKFEGEHNFQNYTSKEEDEQNFIRNISKIEVNKDGDLLSIKLTGNGFMRYMVRYIIGVSLVIASKKEPLSFINETLDQDKRHIVSYKAPAEGLYLLNVQY